MRIVLGILGFLMLIWAVWGKTFRWGLHDFNDDSDIVLNRRTGRGVAAIIGVAFIIGAILHRAQE